MTPKRYTARDKLREPFVVATLSKRTSNARSFPRSRLPPLVCYFVFVYSFSIVCDLRLVLFLIHPVRATECGS